MRTLPVTLVALLALASPAAGQAASRPLDASQARLFLRFLESVARRADALPLVDSVLAAPGTALVLQQQNLSRRVSPAEYREVLLALAQRREPVLAFDRSDPRALRGAEGLVRDVLPALRWGEAHPDLLADRLAALASLRPAPAARTLALANLPEPVPVDVPLLAVMGGRAGAAAVTGGIYFDVLDMSFREGSRYPARARIVEFFAHELHHVGLGELLDREQATLHLDSAGGRAFGLLRGLAMEGSASYLINGHRALAELRRDPDFAAAGSDRDRLVAVERVLTGVLDGSWSAVEYERAMGFFAGNELHRSGAILLDAIWHARGRAGVMAVLADPRLLLLRYDESVARSGDAFRFPASLAQRVARLGD